CYRLIAGLSSIAATIARIRYGRLPLEPKPELGHAANLLFMMTGRVPSPLEEKVMDVALILHADHGMNASTFAALVVASTLSDIYFSVGSGIAALNGPLHGGANEQVIRMLAEIGDENNVDEWFRWKMDTKQKISGFGHRVYKAYDPRARVLGPLAELLVRGNPGMREQFKTAMKLEDKVISTLGAEKKIFPNVDFYSGIVYGALGIPMEMFTPIFAVARVAGWTARILEYLEKNRIFRPRAIYTGDFDKRFVPLDQRR
ncbi:MAG: citrate/2-methylcitrate synthase, partial [Spirochaetota bacterium]